MKVPSFVLAASALLPLAGAFAQSPTAAQTDPPAQPQQQGATFESLDVNSDGKISKTEAAVNANVTAQFASYDKDGNGFIEKAEVSSANSAEKPKQP